MCSPPGASFTLPLAGTAMKGTCRIFITPPSIVCVWSSVRFE